MNKQLMLWKEGIANLLATFRAWLRVMRKEDKNNKVFFMLLDQKPSLEYIALRNRANWVGFSYKSYFEIARCPLTDTIWVIYHEGWGSPARMVYDNEDLHDVIAEMECNQW